MPLVVIWRPDSPKFIFDIFCHVAGTTSMTLYWTEGTHLKIILLNSFVLWCYCRHYRTFRLDMSSLFPWNCHWYHLIHRLLYIFGEGSHNFLINSVYACLRSTFPIKYWQSVSKLRNMCHKLFFRKKSYFLWISDFFEIFKAEFYPRKSKYDLHSYINLDYTNFFYSLQIYSDPAKSKILLWSDFELNSHSGLYCLRIAISF